MNNETQNTIQKIEESLAKQNYNYNNENHVAKVMHIVWVALGVVLLAVVLVTVTGWLTLEEEPTYINNQARMR